MAHVPGVPGKPSEVYGSEERKSSKPTAATRHRHCRCARRSRRLRPPWTPPAWPWGLRPSRCDGHAAVHPPPECVRARDPLDSRSLGVASGPANDVAAWHMAPGKEAGNRLCLAPASGPGAVESSRSRTGLDRRQDLMDPRDARGVELPADQPPHRREAAERRTRRPLGRAPRRRGHDAGRSSVSAARRSSQALRGRSPFPITAPPQGTVGCG